MAFAAVLGRSETQYRYIVVNGCASSVCEPRTFERSAVSIRVDIVGEQCGGCIVHLINWQLSMVSRRNDGEKC